MARSCRQGSEGSLRQSSVKPPHPQGFAYVENLQENPVNVLAELYLDEQVACLTWVVDDFSKIENTSAHVMPASGPRVRINTLETHRRCYRAISLRYNTAT